MTRLTQERLQAIRAFAQGTSGGALLVASAVVIELLTEIDALTTQIAEDREACAQIAGSYAPVGMWSLAPGTAARLAAREIAERIRARKTSEVTK